MESAQESVVFKKADAHFADGGIPYMLRRDNGYTTFAMKDVFHVYCEVLERQRWHLG